ncbi:MAG: cell wall shape-determining protein [Proteobacteria bacterium]|nr:cell wall shape-determining protein [Pseudomonadota bacterium]MBS1246454.1 cell wall shape-determining protein [Pseudomonadota bacterium]
MKQLQRWHIDIPLFYALLALTGISLLVVYSASAENLTILIKHILRLIMGFGILFLIAQIRPDDLRRLAPILFGLGVLLLIAVLGIGIVSKGARRWLGVGGLSFQPSEIMKLALPLMLAWYFARVPLPPNLKQLALAGIITLVPVALIAKQPDLGTAILVLGSGFAMLFLAGMYWRILAGIAALAAVAIPYAWTHLHGYQQKRILTLLDPASDPLGAGYHTLQGMIAIGSGGFFGKGWLNSSQAHLEYLPESSTDFIFAVFAEEFGLLGILVLLGIYLFIVYRGFMIALLAQDSFTRLLAGGLTLVFFFYFFVNVGMVSGILPVVGVPLPLISYGGTAVVTLMAAFGMLMSIHTHRRMTG